MARIQLTTFFALLLLFAHMHCVIEHSWQSVGAERVATLRSLDSGAEPVSAPTEPHSCEGTGCICQGATLVKSFVVDGLDVNDLVSSQPTTLLPIGCIELKRGSQGGGQKLSPAVSPARMRAQLQIFLI